MSCNDICLGFFSRRKPANHAVSGADPSAAPEIYSFIAIKESQRD
jgi:hypothetical protein